jgi:hypothetical protein
VFSRTPGSRLIVAFLNTQRIDDLRMKSIQPDEVPDASRLLSEFNSIPQSRRKGSVAVDGVKPGRSDMPWVVVAFTDRYSFLETCGRDAGK